ncbi:hypothetical protein ACIBQ0_09455 [Nocardia nova]|uniref:hypothetical protein n=1 Tax=Nocardia nova TaxID=37330 RepID=UPI003796E6A5
MIAVPPAVRGAGAARLLVVLAALLGILAIQNTHCSAGSAMAMGPSMTMAASTGASSDCGQMRQGATGDPMVGPQQPTTVAVAEASMHTHADHASPALPCDIAMACLAVFLSLLTVLAVALPMLGRVRVHFPRPIRDLRRVSAPSRPPSLCELCILRT